ncbi:hypothetical protein GCM10028862_06500 [Luteimonas pelagia]
MNLPRLPAGALLLAAIATLSACGGERPEPARPVDAAPAQASVRVGDVTLRANVVETGTLGEEVARRYGIERRPGVALLFVGVRRGDGAGEQALPARVSATVTDLRGNTRPVALRELRSGEGDAALVDYAGTVEYAPPETLRFDIEADWGAARRGELQLQRDFGRP